MSLQYVEVVFEGTSKRYNYYTTGSVNIGDFAVVLAPRGPALVEVVEIVEKNSVANQPLLSIFTEDMLSKVREDTQKMVKKVSNIEAEIEQRIKVIAEKRTQSYYEDLDPEISRLMKKLKDLS